MSDIFSKQEQYLLLYFTNTCDNWLSMKPENKHEPLTWRLFGLGSNTYLHIPANKKPQMAKNAKHSSMKAEDSKNVTLTPLWCEINSHGTETAHTTFYKQ